MKMENKKENNETPLSFNDYRAKMELTGNKEDYYEYLKVKKTMENMRIAVKDIIENRKKALKNYNDFREKTSSWYKKYRELDEAYDNMKNEWFFYVSGIKNEEEEDAEI